MSFADRETSRFSGEPVNLYLFRYGSQTTEFFAYTDHEESVPFDGFTYNPMPIDRTKLTSAGTLDKSKVTVTTPQDSPLARLYLAYPPSAVTTVIMRQGHVGDDDFKVVWTGRVMGCALKGSKAEFACEPVSASLRRNGLRRRYQYGCPHVLYGDQCRASKVAATTAVAIVSASGNRVTLGSGWSPQPKKYVGGLIEWANEAGALQIRTILSVEAGGSTYLLSGPTAGLSPGHTVQMVLGCNHKLGHGPQPDGDCGPLHNNAQNFGGQPWIPLKNPLAFGVNQFYGG